MNTEMRGLRAACVLKYLDSLAFENGVNKESGERTGPPAVKGTHRKGKPEVLIGNWGKARVSSVRKRVECMKNRRSGGKESEDKELYHTVTTGHEWLFNLN